MIFLPLGKKFLFLFVFSGIPLQARARKKSLEKPPQKPNEKEEPRGNCSRRWSPKWKKAVLGCVKENIVGSTQPDEVWLLVHVMFKNPFWFHISTPMRLEKLA